MVFGSSSHVLCIVTCYNRNDMNSYWGFSVMKFTKMHGCGNDYVYIDCTKEPLADPEQMAITLSDRHFGVGGDGMILICPSETGDFRMAMYNSDGSEGSMCGNGIRCVGKFVYDKGLTQKTDLTIETKSGLKRLNLEVENGLVSRVRVDMGRADWSAPAVPVVGMGDSVIGQPVEIAGQTWEMTCISMGNPHAVVWADDVAHLPLEEIGPCFETHPMFPERVNTEFIRVIDDHTLEMRVWERGSGETLACGTGACASVMAAYLNHRTGTKATVQLRGGALEIELAENGHVYMTGPACTVFEGELSR